MFCKPVSCWMGSNWVNDSEHAGRRSRQTTEQTFCSNSHSLPHAWVNLDQPNISDQPRWLSLLSFMRWLWWQNFVCFSAEKIPTSAWILWCRSVSIVPFFLTKAQWAISLVFHNDAFTFPPQFFPNLFCVNSLPLVAVTFPSSSWGNSGTGKVLARRRCYQSFT